MGFDSWSTSEVALSYRGIQWITIIFKIDIFIKFSKKVSSKKVLHEYFELVVSVFLVFLVMYLFL